MKPTVSQGLRPDSRPVAPDQAGAGGGDRTSGPASFDRLKRAGELRPKGFSFEIPENRLCAELGMGKDELRARREYFLVQGQHWDLVNKRVLLSVVGAEILRGTRDAVLPEKSAPGDSAPPRRPVALLLEKNAPPVAFAGTLVAWATPSRNKKLVVCYLPGTDPSNPLNLVSLHVRDNGNFLRGMLVPPTTGPGSAVEVKRVSEWVFELLGQCPRRRGRW